MKQSNLKTAALLLILLLLCANLLFMYQTKQELARLNNNYSATYNQMQSGLANLQYQVQNNYNSVENLLKEGQSFLSDSSVDFTLQNHQLLVTMRAVPKELKSGETLFARVEAGGKTYEQATDADYQAVLAVDMAEEITPVFVIRSDAGVRQESLDSIYVTDRFIVPFQSTWLDSLESSSGATTGLDSIPLSKGKHVLSMRIQLNETSPLFTREDIETASFVVLSTSAMEESGSLPEAAAVARAAGDPEFYKLLTAEDNDFPLTHGEMVPASLLDGTGDFSLLYYADFTSFFEKKENIQYEIYFALTTKDGISYASLYEPAATFSSSEKSSDSGCGNGSLTPLFP